MIELKLKRFLFKPKDINEKIIVANYFFIISSLIGLVLRVPDWKFGY